METHFHLPKPERLSTISASILLAYALLPFIRVPTREIAFPFLGVLVSFRLDFYHLISAITAVMAASGMDWMLRDHPLIQGKSTLPHLILPAFTAGAIGFPLGLLEMSAAWWILMALGSLLIILVLVAEYISLDKNDIRYPLSLMVLSAICYSLFLILAIALRAVDMRLYMLLLILPPMLAFFCLRILNFRLGGRWRFLWASVIALVIAQLLISLHYWPLSPVRFGLILLGPAYALIGTAASLEKNPDISKLYVEPLIIMGIIWVMSIFIG